MSLFTGRKWPGLLIRILIIAVIFALIARNLDWGGTLEVLRDCSFAPLLGAVLLYLCNRLLSAVKWKFLLEHNGISVGLGSLLRIIFESNVLGIMIPSSFGADLVRTVHLGRREQNLTAVVGSVLADRMLSVMVLASIAVTASFLAWPLVEDKNVLLAVGAFGAAAATFIVLCMGDVFFRLYSLARRLFGFLNRAVFRGSEKVRNATAAILGKIEEVHSSFSRLKKSGKLFASVVAINVIVQLFRVGQIHFIFLALGVSVPITIELAFVPIILLLIFLPFFPYMGLGVKEAAFIYFFGLAGVPAEVSFSASILSHLVIIAGVLPGIVLFFTGSGKRALADSGGHGDGR